MHRAPTILGHSGTQIAYASYWNFVAEHACVLRIAFRAKLSSLERDLWGWICQVANRAPYLIRTVRYVIRTRILHAFLR